MIFPIDFDNTIVDGGYPDISQQPATTYVKHKQHNGQQMIFAIDFDGTIVDHKYPDIGEVVPGAFKWLKRLQDNGAKLILYTMRDKETLKEAVDYCRNNGITFFGVNENPQQHTWTTSPKVYAHRYVDDAAAFCPLVANLHGGRPYVDWEAMGPFLLDLLLKERK